MAKRYGNSRSNRSLNPRSDNFNDGYRNDGYRNDGYRNDGYRNDGYRNDGYYSNQSELRYDQDNRLVNHRRDKFNDKDRNDQDFSQEGFLRNQSEAQHYMGMPVRMRSGLEKEQNPMIREDHRAIANLPQEVMFKAYPQTGPYNPEDLDDTIRGVDAQMNYDDRQRDDHFYPKKV